MMNIPERNISNQHVVSRAKNQGGRYKPKETRNFSSKSYSRNPAYLYRQQSSNDFNDYELSSECIQ